MAFKDFLPKLLNNNSTNTNNNTDNNNTNNNDKTNTNTNTNTDTPTKLPPKYYYMQHPFGGLSPKKLDIFGCKESLESGIFKL